MHAELFGYVEIARDRVTRADSYNGPNVLLTSYVTFMMCASCSVQTIARASEFRPPKKSVTTVVAFSVISGCTQQAAVSVEFVTVQDEPDLSDDSSESFSAMSVSNTDGYIYIYGCGAALYVHWQFTHWAAKVTQVDLRHIYNTYTF